MQHSQISERTVHNLIHKPKTVEPEQNNDTTLRKPTRTENAMEKVEHLIQNIKLQAK